MVKKDSGPVKRSAPVNNASAQKIPVHSVTYYENHKSFAIEICHLKPTDTWSVNSSEYKV